MPEKDSEDKNVHEPASQKWQAWAAVAAIILAMGGFFYQQSETSGANAVTLLNHTTQINNIQVTQQNEQVMLSSINEQLATLTQEIADMRQDSKAGHQ